MDDATTDVVLELLETVERLGYRKTANDILEALTDGRAQDAYFLAWDASLLWADLRNTCGVLYYILKDAYEANYCSIEGECMDA